MSYVLAIEPDQEQAGVLRDSLAASATAKVVLAESVSSAMSAIEREVPCVILLNALLSPRDESLLLERLRSLPRNAAPEILITPALSAPVRDEPAPGGRSFFRRRRSKPPVGCSPLVFASQLSEYLSRVEPREPVAAHEVAVAPQSTLTGGLTVAHEPMLEASGRDRRASSRIERVEWASVRLNGTPVTIVDLSVTGAQVLSPSVLRLGGSVHVMLSRDADIVQCDASIVWGAFEIPQSAMAPLFRAGISFRDADRLAVERLCLERAVA